MNYQVTNKNRILILMVIILSLIFVSLFVNLVMGQDIVYTHLFYLPIILAGLWFYKKAFSVAVFMSFFHMGINFFQEGTVASSVLTRSIILCLIAYVIGTLAEKKDYILVALDKAQREKLMILQNLTELVAFHDKEQRIIWANPAAGKIFGVNPAKLVGKKCYEVWHKRQSPCENCPVIQALKTGQVERNEIRTSDGRYWNVIGSPVRDDDGNIIGAIETGLEITERKLAEAKLQELNTELEERVRARTAELEALNKELDAFSYSVSHDLRSPLNNIDGFSKALKEDYWDRLDTQGRDYLLRICRSTRRMGELIDDLLKLSRVTRQNLQREKVDLSQIASSYLTMMQEQEPQRQVECIVTPGISEMGDFSLLRIVLENLLGNAWKFTNNRKQARIEFGVTEHDDGRKIYYVSDNGAGFNMEYADRLFTPFQRLHAQGEYSGTGIGLSIVARIVQRHGGKLWATGEEGRGATFYFTLGT